MKMGTEMPFSKMVSPNFSKSRYDGRKKINSPEMMIDPINKKVDHLFHLLTFRFL
jgi:hypothetical protein